MTSDREAELVRLVLAMADKIYLMSSHLSRLAERRHQGGATMDGEYCYNCKYLFDNDDGTASCRRYPPNHPEQINKNRFIYWYPEVEPNSWCGEWKAKEGDGGNRVAE